MKKLTQDIFKDAPRWVKSVAVDSGGDAYFYSVPVSDLTLDSDECWWVYMGAANVHDYGDDYVGDGFDPTDWQNSAIDRESVK